MQGMTMEKLYDVVIIGGGVGGLQAAIHAGRYGWNTLVIDRSKGRTFYTPNYMNMLGYPDGVSGVELLKKGKAHAEKYGVEFLMKVATDVAKDDDGLFTITAQRRKEYKAGSSEQIDVIRTRKIVMSTGIMDRHPEVPNVYHWAGYGIYYCADCDGFEVLNKRVVVVGKGNAAPNKALMLLNWTKAITVVNVDPNATINDDLKKQLEEFNIPVFNSPLKEFVGEDRERIEKVILQDGTVIESDKVFSALGMHSVHSELAKKLGVETLENGHIPVDPRTKQTNVPEVWAVGDIVAHTQQAMIAVGEGAQAGVWVNKILRQEGHLPTRWVNWSHEKEPVFL
jgi:thioredoxin reductase